MADYDEKKDSAESMLEHVQKCYKEAKKHSANWRIEAVENYDFRDGKQWSMEDIQTLEAAGRPLVTFNRMGPYFDSVAGSEINNRQKITYLPRTLKDSQQNEILTAAVDWARERCNAADEESDSFQDVLVTGMGWVETRMEYDDDPDGKVVEERTDPLEMYWDPSAKKRNLQDAKWQQRVKWLDKEEIAARWPDVEIGTSSTLWSDEEAKSQPHQANLAFLYRENSTTSYDAKTGKYRVVQHMSVEHEEMHRTVDPSTAQIVNLTAEKFALAQKTYAAQGHELKSTKVKQKVYKYCFFVGDELAEEGTLKCGFNIKCITGKRDNNTNTWYGLARVMKDPQRWANKFLAQIMHIINTNAKGGLLAETGAFVDPKKAEENWSDPSAIIMLKNGGIGKIKERTAANYPQGLDKLLQFAISSIPDATGINLEFMGAQDRAQAGILEQERKKAALVVLAVFFDSLRLFRKEQGRLLAHFVKEYMNDGRIIRITTDEGEKPVPLKLTEDMIDYDVIVDQAPDSPNLKTEVWAALKEIIPSALKSGMQVPPSVWGYSPLPSKVAAEFTASMQGKLPPQVEQQMQDMGKQIQQLGQENHDLKQQAQIKLKQDQTKHELGTQKNQVEASKVENEVQAMARQMHADMLKMAQESQNELVKLRAEMERDSRESMQKMQLEMLKLQATMEGKRADAAMKAAERRHAQEDKAAEKAEKTAEKEAAKSAAPPVINITNVIPEGNKTITLKKNGKETVGAEVRAS